MCLLVLSTGEVLTNAKGVTKVTSVKFPGGHILRSWRIAERYTQEAIAKKLGVHQGTVSDWELGIWPNSAQLVPLARLLAVEVEELLEVDAA